jgi:hypothetical protein
MKHAVFVRRNFGAQVSIFQENDEIYPPCAVVSVFLAHPVYFAKNNFGLGKERERKKFSIFCIFLSA